MFAAIAISAAGGFVLGIVFAKQALAEAQTVKTHITAEATKLKTDILAEIKRAKTEL